MWKTYLINPTPFYGKILNKLGVEGNFLDLTKVIYEKPTDNLITDTKNWLQKKKKNWLLSHLDQEHNNGFHFCHFYSTLF